MAVKKPLVESSGIVQEIASGDFVQVPSGAIANGATSPDPGGTSARGVMMWSTSLSDLVIWNGTQWNRLSSSSTFDYGTSLSLNYLLR